MNDAAATSPQSRFNLHQVYTKDLSFESPQSPAVFTWKEYRPDTEVDLKAQQNLLDADKHLYEVVLTVTVTAKQADEVVFLVEAQQGGVFTVEGSTPEMLEMLLEAACPTVLYPYLRETVSGLTAKGGFPQFLLGPVNFDAMYLQKKNQGSEQATNGA